MSFIDEIHTLYARRPHPIQPWIGEAFASRAQGTLRVLAIGINAYVADADWPPAPEWFAAWFAEARWRFQKGVASAAAELTAHLSGPCGAFEGLAYAGTSSVFLTNAIRTWLRASEGRHAQAIAPALLAEHAGDFREELAIMARHEVLPHVVLVFGAPFWPLACEAFRTLGGAVSLERHEAFHGPVLHHVNRYRFRLGARSQDLLLVRVRHPAARTETGSIAWLLSDPDFLLAAGRDVPSPPELAGATICRRIAAFEGVEFLAGVSQAGPFAAVDSGTLRDFLGPEDGAFSDEDFAQVRVFATAAERRAWLGLALGGGEAGRHPGRR